MGWHALFCEAATVGENVAKMLEGAHSIYSFVSHDGDVTTSNLRRIAGTEAKVVTVLPRPGEDFHGHVSEHLLGELDAAPAVKVGVGQILKSIALRGIG